ncbi:MAG: hypothetical protein KBI09_11975 [Mesotoga sp.]|nr:hypothetical protein [Mesotoga sp.]
MEKKRVRLLFSSINIMEKNRVRLLFSSINIMEKNRVRLLFSSINIRTQDMTYSLFDTPRRAFALRPDIVLEFGKRKVVMDTKWKLLSDTERNGGISQSDMYQMYAYGKKYEADRIVLVYPYSDRISRTDIEYSSEDNVRVDVRFVDLRTPDSSISDILSEVTKALEWIG